MFNLHKQEVAHAETRRQLSTGESVMPNKCERCPEKKNIQAHHPDYNKPNFIVWLCIKCHRKAHIQDAEQDRKRRKKLLKMRLGNVSHLIKTG